MCKSIIRMRTKKTHGSREHNALAHVLWFSLCVCVCMEVFEPWRDSRGLNPSYLQQFVNSGLLLAIFCGVFVLFHMKRLKTTQVSSLLDQHVLGGN